MKDEDIRLIKKLYRAHPWHGVSIGKTAPDIVTAYIEIVPTDAIKYELDKNSGFLKIDRPQRFSNTVPALYGMIPQTLCDKQVAELCREKTGYKNIVGDNDPLDICVLAEKNVLHGDIILRAVPIGGLRMIDHSEADDKIIAVLQNDPLYGHWKNISDCSKSILERLKHYFLTYKNIPELGEQVEQEITHTYGREEALDVITRSQEDYKNAYPEMYELFKARN